MIARVLVVAVAVLAAPAAALACSGAKTTGTTMASAGSVPHSAQAKAGTCSNEQAVTASATPGAAHDSHGVVPGKITVAELVKKLAAKPAAVAVDVNNEQTRAKEGMIPGAKLLTSASQYDPAKELGTAKDAELVFYCANTRCTASHTAAMRAIEAGYNHVSILPEGIAGWKAAGKATNAVPRS